MLSELGNFFLAMAIGFTSMQILASFWGIVSPIVPGLLRAFALAMTGGKDRHCEERSDKAIHNNNYITLGRVATFLQGGFVSAAFLTLIIAFFLCDFSIATVAFHDHTRLPWYYRIAATWGNHEGSLLLFVLILSAMGLALATFLQASFFRARALTVQGLLTLLFLLFLILSSNPFAPLPFSLPDGNSLNPLLQDRSLLIHPPLLYLGYVGFSAPFSLAVAALWGEADVQTWGTIVRPWVLFAWGALTAGIALGSWWAYYELGWGGWWFWDPVENASLMPWLAGTALLHTLRTETLYRWSLLLSLLTFGLSLLGTFLVRSGVITSVHSFAQDPTRGFFILCLLGGIMGFALFMWVWKAPRLQSPQLSFFSRRGTLLLNSLLFSVGLATVILGTLYPLWSDWMWGEQIAIGAPYFERTFVPLMMPLLFLIPVGSILRERGEPLLQLLITPLIAALVAAFLLLFVLYPTSLWTFTGIVVAIWVIAGTVTAFTKKRLAFGPTLAHLGVGVTLLGVSVAGGFRSDKTQILGLKENLQVGGIKLILQNVQLGQGSTYRYEKATLTTPGGVLTPEKRLYEPQNFLLSETSILTNGLRDFYVVLGPYQGDNRWLIKASSIPLAPWIWSGGFLMVLGAIFSFIGSRLSRLLRLYAVPHELKLDCFAPKGLAITVGGGMTTPPIRHCKGESPKQSRGTKHLFLLILLSLPMASFADEPLETRAQALYRQVRCPECAGQSIADSNSPQSKALRGFIDDQLKDGRPDEVIRDELRTLFGDEILFHPPFQIKTLFLWLAPFGLFFLIICIFLWKGYRSRAKK